MLIKTGKKGIFDYTFTHQIMEEIIFIVEQEEDGGFIAEAKVNDNEQIITEGDNIEELKSMIREALELHFDNAENMPKTVRMQFVKEEVFIV